MKKFLMTLISLMAICPVMVGNIIDGINYELDVATLTAKVIESSSKYSGSVNIPSTVKDGYFTYKVTEIGGDAFWGCKDLTSVTIPNSITRIGTDAFHGCTGLASVTIPNSVTEIGGQAFYGCSGLKSVTIPNSVKTILGAAFKNCTALTSVTIPNSVTQIGAETFENCSGLKSVTIGNSITRIERSTFWGCSSLTSVTIPNSVTYIGMDAFNGCTGLKSVIIGKSVTSVHSSAFSGCSGLIKSCYPNTISDPFRSYGVSKSYPPQDAVIANGGVYSGTTLYFVSIDAEEYVIPSNITLIASYAFAYCDKISEIKIPSSVTSISTYAFAQNTSLKTIYNKAAVPQKIDSSVFDGVDIYSITLYVPYNSLQLYQAANIWKEMLIKADLSTGTIEIDDIIYVVETTKGTAYCKGPRVQSIVKNDLALKSAIEIDGISYPVVSINENAFQKCTGLSGTLTIPNSVKSLGKYAFDGCINLDGVKIGNSLEEIGFGAFYDCNGLKNVEFETPSSLVSIEDWAFNNCTSLTSIDLPASVTTLKYCAFYNCTGLKEITIPESVTTIGQWVFNGCKSLTTVALPNTITEIGDHAFFACSGLTKVNIPTSLTAIGNQVFANCNLSEIVIPATVNSIGTNAFEGNDNMAEVYSYNPIPPTCTDGTSFSASTKSNAKLYVPLKSIPDYQEAVCWKDFYYITNLPIPATEIKLNKEDLSLTIGQEETLVATLTPEDATSEIVWSKQDYNNVISVDQEGKVTALAVGQATVVATAGEVTTSCLVTVMPVLATSITIEGGGIKTLKETATLQLTANILPANVTYREVTWESSDTGIATVESNGLVTAVGVGEVEIKAYLTNQKEMQATYPITIERRIPGDANDNGVVNVADVVAISDFLVQKEVMNFCFVNADVIQDNKITTADLTAIVNIIMDDVPSLAMSSKGRGPAVSNDLLKADDFTVDPSGSFSIGVDLEASNSYSALRASLILPEGMTLEGISPGEKTNRHILNYNLLDPSHIELVIYSLSNAELAGGNGNLFNLVVTAKEDCGDLSFTEIWASDSRSNEFELGAEGGHNEARTTSIAGFGKREVVVIPCSSGIEIRNASGNGYKVYSLGGETIVSDKAASDKERISLEKGIYLVVVNGKAFKALVK